VSSEGLAQAEEKMREAGVAEEAIATFRHYYEQLEAGESGMLPEAELEPLGDVPDLADLPEAEAPLDQAVILKLNGGLGTSMGMTHAKSLVEVKDGLTFLDIIARQVLELRKRHDARLPLILMNSFSTRDDTLAKLEDYGQVEADVPLDFLQNKEPKLRADDLTPVEWPDDPDLEWCPPGHGDLFTALRTSGMLEKLLGAGYRYAFMSNSDNLGAVLEPRILGWMASEGHPWVSEVVDRTEADRKGGHIARRKDEGNLVLRETAQVPEEDQESFEDTDRWCYFNANNLWVDLERLSEVLEEREGVLGLPMIVNRKTVDPSDSSSPEVIQIETAMGAAIGVFDGAQAVRVPRTRFAPVKTTNDLLVLRSDAYVLCDDYRVLPADGLPMVDLDSAHYKLLRDFDAHFPAGPPSLAACDRLVVDGDVIFGRDVVVRGSVEVHQDGEEPRRIEDGAVLES
jgi:UTP--glucose-1-phosphate uridylyltransferase